MRDSELGSLDFSIVLSLDLIHNAFVELVECLESFARYWDLGDGFFCVD